MSTHEARVRRTLTADRGTVWRHLIEEPLLGQWFCPNPQLALDVDADARPGGAYRADMGGEYVAAGEYTEVAAPERLGFTWAWESAPVEQSQVVIALTEADDGGTELELVHSGLADADEATGHGEGWELALDRLVELVDGPATASD